MSILMRSHTWLVLGAGILICIVLFSVVRVVRGPEMNLVTDSVTLGPVQELVSVSGVIEAENTAELAFSVSGIVSEVAVNEGDEVEKEDVLATLERTALLADRQDALAALQIAEANKRELIAGPTAEARDISFTTVAAASENLARVTKEENEKVENARRSLYSKDLEALPDKKELTNDAPTITGTYTCENEGVYVLEMFGSAARSGYSYKLSGLEQGVDSAYTGAPGALGECGLRIQFLADGRFGSTDWTIPVPNPAGASYASNLNTYELALEQRDNRVAAAEEALELAQKEQTLENAAPRSESLDRANATILQAEARLGAVDAALADRTLRAPFAGTITDVAILPGETVTTVPVVTLLSQEVFELTARIPEIDIAKVAVGQRAEVIFDAESNTTLMAELIFISPIATEIDGVGYFEAKLKFENPPVWLRSGLNADIEIITKENKNTQRIPRRFLITESDSHYVQIFDNNRVVQKSVSIELMGNDGFVGITGLKEGTEIVAP